MNGINATYAAQSSGSANFVDFFVCSKFSENCFLNGYILALKMIHVLWNILFFHIKMKCVLWSAIVFHWSDFTCTLNANVVNKRCLLLSLQMMTMLVMTVINYFLSWLPYHVISIVGDVNPSVYDSKDVHALWIMAHLLSFSNSGTNAIIYYWRNNNFRIAFRNLRKGLKKGPLSKAENQRIPIRSMSSYNYRRNSRLSSTWSS